MDRKRGQNEGSIIQRKDGRWMGRVTLDDGRRKAYYGRTRAEVSSQVVKALTQLQQGIAPADDRITVSAFLESWLEDTAKARVRYSTWRGYKQNVDLYLTPELGKLRLSKMQPAHVEKMLRKMQEERGLSARTAQYAHAVLRVALKAALRRGQVHRNVAALVDAPTVRREPVQPLTVNQAKTVLAEAKSHPLGNLFIVALGLGLRRGEVVGLRWEDVDMDEARLWVRVTLQRQKDKGLVVVEPKSRSSRRPLALPPFVVEAFRDQRRRQATQRLAEGPDWQDLGWVFTMQNGRPVSPDYTSSQFRAFLVEMSTRCPSCEDGHIVEGVCDACKVEAKVTVPSISFHGLRHSCASLLFAQGCSMRLVMEILGHSQIALTANTYTHLLPEADREAATAMQAIIGGE